MILEKVYDELMAQIEDLKKAVAGGTGSKDYDKLDNRPKVNNITLTGNKKSSDLKIAYSMTEAEYAAATKNVESIYCLQENSGTITDSAYVNLEVADWAEVSGVYKQTKPFVFEVTPVPGWTIEDVTIETGIATVDSYEVTEDPFGLSITYAAETLPEYGITATVTVTINQPAGGSRIVKAGIEFGADLYSESPVKVGTWIDGRPVYRQVIKSTLSTGGSASFGGFYEATMDTSELHVDDLISAYGYFDYNSGGKDYRRSWFLYGVDETGDISVYSNSQRSNVSSTVVITYTRKDD